MLLPIFWINIIPLDLKTKMSEIQVRGTIAVFAKCPIAGSSKTRLSSLLGDDGAADLAQAMLSDILCNISNYVSYLSFLL